MSDYMAGDPPYKILEAQLDDFVNERAHAARTSDEERDVLHAALARDLIQLDEVLDLVQRGALGDFSLAHWPAAREFVEAAKRLVTPTEGDL